MRNNKQTARERWNWANLETEGIEGAERGLLVHKDHPVVIMLKHDNVIIGHNDNNRNADIGQLMLYKVIEMPFSASPQRGGGQIVCGETKRSRGRAAAGKARSNASSLALMDSINDIGTSSQSSVSAALRSPSSPGILSHGQHAIYISAGLSFPRAPLSSRSQS